MGCPVEGKTLLFHSDNMVVVKLWNKGISAHGDLMSIVRKLFYCSPRNELTVNIIHIPGIKNPISDALSRFQFHRFQNFSTRGRSTPDQSTTSNLGKLSGEMSFYQYMSLSISFRRTYLHGQRKYEDFCKRYNLHPYPTTEHKLKLFAYSTIKVYLAAMRPVTKLELGYPDNFGNMQALHLLFGASQQLYLRV